VADEGQATNLLVMATRSLHHDTLYCNTIMESIY
jgi:hypothetical protein